MTKKIEAPAFPFPTAKQIEAINKRDALRGDAVAKPKVKFVGGVPASKVSKRQPTVKSTTKTSVAAERQQQIKEFKLRKSLTKAEVCKLKAGSWLRIKWEDSPDTVVLLLAKPIREVGDICLHCYHPERGFADRHVMHDQVLDLVGVVEVPKLK